MHGYVDDINYTLISRYRGLFDVYHTVSFRQLTFIDPPCWHWNSLPTKRASDLFEFIEENEFLLDQL